MSILRTISIDAIAGDLMLGSDAGGGLVASAWVCCMFGTEIRCQAGLPNMQVAQHRAESWLWIGYALYNCPLDEVGNCT